MIELKSLTRAILEDLRMQIITCELKGGQKLNENQFSSQLNVSRPPLREAFQILEQENFIVSIPRKGRHVAEISESNYEKIHEVRKMIECHVVDLLKAKNVRSLPTVDLALREVLKKPVPRDDLEKWHLLQAADEFHVRLVDSVGNEVLSRFYGIIKFNVARYQYWLRVLCVPDLFRPDVAKSLIQEHCRIFSLIERGEYDEARECLRSHMDETWRLMKENFSKEVGQKFAASTH
ncbi:MAG: hypothetical protein A2157_10825 [Deltaproteobacteria bacterium RBG_16_47_11]|nr:MAG: hypothetical protein A2157_10825 [Deltaproteobacteria bacterium RBG_16_47_11]